MGNPLRTAERLVAEDVLSNSQRVIGGSTPRATTEGALNHDSAIVGGGPPSCEIEIDGIKYSSALAPFEDDAKIIWALKKALLCEFTKARIEGLSASVQIEDEDKALFLAGVTVGLVKAARLVAESYLKAMWEAIGGIIQYYRLASDPEIWVRVWYVYRGQVGSTKELDEVAAYLRQGYPSLWAAMSSYPSFRKGLERLIADLEDGRALANLLVAFATALPELLYDEDRNSKLDEFIRLKNEPYDQGVLVGEAVGVPLIQCILFILDLRSMVRSLLRSGQRLAENRIVVSKITAMLNETKELKTAAQGIRRVQSEAEKLYEQLAEEIKSYKELRKRTGAFNDEVAGSLKSRQDREYIGLRLDADHILEDRVHSWFPDDFKKLAYLTPDDMDAIAVHTEFHIRSGEGLTDVFEISDKTLVGQKSLTDLKLKFIGMDPSQYPNLRSLVERYELFYQSQAPLYYPRVSDWFQQLKARMHALNM